jgi:hypothetical protein
MIEKIRAIELNDLVSSKNSQIVIFRGKNGKSAIRFYNHITRATRSRFARLWDNHEGMKHVGFGIYTSAVIWLK